MAEDKPSQELGTQKTDYVTSAAKAVLGMVPFAGSLLTELAGTVIPNQRIDRLTKFAIVLETKLANLEQEFVRSQLNNEHFSDLLEEGLRQAARSLSEERREHIANLIANSLSSEDIEYVESKHLLRLLGEINDIEVIWLKYYQDRRRNDGRELWEKHGEVLKPIVAAIGDSHDIVDKGTLQRSYKDHLVQLGLLAHRYKIDRDTGLPEVDTFHDDFEIRGYRITPLGTLLVRQTEEV